MESTSYVLSFQMVFFYLVTTGWIFDISLCENSINQSAGRKKKMAGYPNRQDKNIKSRAAVLLLVLMEAFTCSSLRGNVLQYFFQKHLHL